MDNDVLKHVEMEPLTQDTGCISLPLYIPIYLLLFKKEKVPLRLRHLRQNSSETHHWRGMYG
jgi:hypothetical protein